MTKQLETKVLVEEVKEQKMLNELYKKNTIEFSNYFKYSGKIEEYKPLHEFECNQSPKSVIDTEDPLLKYYLKNSDMPIKEISRKFGYKSDGPLKRKLDAYFKRGSFPVHTL